MSIAAGSGEHPASSADNVAHSAALMATMTTVAPTPPIAGTMHAEPNVSAQCLTAEKRSAVSTAVPKEKIATAGDGVTAGPPPFSAGNAKDMSATAAEGDGVKTGMPTFATGSAVDADDLAGMDFGEFGSAPDAAPPEVLEIFPDSEMAKMATTARLPPESSAKALGLKQPPTNPKKIPQTAAGESASSGAAETAPVNRQQRRAAERAAAKAATKSSAQAKNKGAPAGKSKREDAAVDASSSESGSDDDEEKEAGESAEDVAWKTKKRRSSLP